jgi:hypothetical protein
MIERMDDIIHQAYRVPDVVEAGCNGRKTGEYRINCSSDTCQSNFLWHNAFKRLNALTD